MAGSEAGERLAADEAQRPRVAAAGDRLRGRLPAGHMLPCLRLTLRLC